MGGWRTVTRLALATICSVSPGLTTYSGKSLVGVFSLASPAALASLRAAAARAPACKSIYVTQGEVGRRLGFEFEWKQPLAADNLERSRGEKVGRQMDYLLHTAIPAAV